MACWPGYKQVGMKKKGGRKVPNCVKASKGLLVEEQRKKSKEPGMEEYTGSYIRSEIDGKKVSNKSYEIYYKGMI
jgi:hypothetical protein